MKEIDCRGLDCPEPVLRSKSALEDENSDLLTIIVDNQVARDNVMRFLRSRNLQPEYNENQGIYQISVKPGSRQAEIISPSGENVLKASQQGPADRPVLFISTDQLGTGSSELGRLLQKNFIYTLTKRDEMPLALVFMNSGVKLSVEDSPVLEDLKILEEGGVEILVCGTCLDYYKLKEQHRVGQVSNMYDIADLLLSAARVVTI